MTDVLVLCYHAVSDSWPAGLSMATDHLAQQLSSLVSAGYRGATFHQALTEPPHPLTLAVTFDDAYRSVHERALPILADLGLPGTVFVPTAFAGSERPMSWPGIERWLGGEHEHELVPMDWDELGELQDSGWEIGSHTQTHARLPALDADAMSEELEGSRMRCEERLGGACVSFAYPFGDHSPAAVAAVGAAGYRTAGALTGRVRHPMALLWPRTGIYHDDGSAAFRLKTSRAMRRLRATRVWRARFLLRRHHR